RISAAFDDDDSGRPRESREPEELGELELEERPISSRRSDTPPSSGRRHARPHLHDGARVAAHDPGSLAGVALDSAPPPAEIDLDFGSAPPPRPALISQPEEAPRSSQAALSRSG